MKRAFRCSETHISARGHGAKLTYAGAILVAVVFTHTSRWPSVAVKLVYAGACAAVMLTHSSVSSTRMKK